MASRITKLTTGLTGLQVVQDPTKHLKIIYARILKSLQHMPETSEYRNSTTNVIMNRLNLIETEPDISKIEKSIGLGQIEEIILQAEYELKLVRTMLKYKPWEPLTANASENQWKWPV
ncbi:putative NADH dehydrogenase [ubiquinone] 1 alpha subcomplex subunit 5 [Trichinella papuae]|uniref:Putative NADH dehydrogenase [ubiquinone] 1 alpha subcomplex subunit 5 n=1 Tax=Trichinella papuae TaxID=268474 RepID=A0A0V1MGD0_9BILA|nr:putative NADH dehydrogenase [ubiquinone] 1 alpha subcomplex subunit 5 [Trichinella papuae]